MNKYKHLKEKALEFRARGMALDEICEYLALGKGTVYYWIKGITIPKTSRQFEGQKKGTRGVVEKYKILREGYYSQGLIEYEHLKNQPTFKDMVILYLTEGYRRNRNSVSIVNSNPKILKLSHYWFSRLCRNYKPDFWIQYHVDQSLEKLKIFWGHELNINPECIKFQRKSNSGGLKGRNWRSEFGVLTLRLGNTEFRAKLQAWMDCVEKEWEQKLFKN